MLSRWSASPGSPGLMLAPLATVPAVAGVASAPPRRGARHVARIERLALRGGAPRRLAAPGYDLPLARRLHVGADRGRAAAASNGAAWNPASGGDRVASWSDKRKAAVG